MSEGAKDLQSKFALGLEVAGLGLGAVDYIADTITLDPRAAEIFDLPSDTALARSTLHARIHPDDWGDVDYQLEKLLDPNCEPFIDVQHRVVHESGDIVWVSARKQVEFRLDEDGETLIPVSGLVALIDITAHKADQQRIQYLLDELNHRSKNLLAVIQSLARRTMTGGDPDTAFDRFTDRLEGLMRNQDALAKGNWEQADLKHLIQSHLAPFRAAGAEAVQVTGPNVALSTGAAQAVGMAMHELATNAAKYGALSKSGGRVSVDIALSDDTPHTLTITWAESGGPPVTAPTHVGFGQKVLGQMAEAGVDGKVVTQYRPEGLFWQLTMPETHITRL